MTKRGRPRHPDVLTPREWEVLSLIRDGLTNEQIAERIGVTIHAARYHVSQILSKLGVGTREEAAVWQPEPEKAGGSRWLRVLQVGLALSASAVVVALGVIAWGVLRGSEGDAQAGAIQPETPTLIPPHSRSPGDFPPNVRDMQLVTESFGWLLTDEGLFAQAYVQPNCPIGADCHGEPLPPRKITPEGVSPPDIRGVRFLDPSHGWLVANGPLDSSLMARPLRLFRTIDSGANWRSFAVTNASILYELTKLNPVYIDFIDADVGWIVIDTQQMNRLSGELWHTTNGGDIWTPLSVPAGHPVNFVNKNDGWLVGGVTNDHLFATHDGGKTWEDASDIMPFASWVGTPAFGLPTSVLDGTELVLPVTLAVSPNPSLLMLFRSTDGGATWPKRALAEIGSDVGVGTRTPSKVFEDANAIAFALDGTGLRYSAADNTFTTFTSTDVAFPDKIDFAGVTRGWAFVSGCGPGRQCPYYPATVLQTNHAGMTWTRLNIPEVSSAPTP